MKLFVGVLDVFDVLDAVVAERKSLIQNDSDPSFLFRTFTLMFVNDVVMGSVKLITISSAECVARPRPLAHQQTLRLRPLHLLL